MTLLDMMLRTENLSSTIVFDMIQSFVRRRVSRIHNVKNVIHLQRSILSHFISFEAYLRIKVRLK